MRSTLFISSVLVLLVGSLLLCSKKPAPTQPAGTEPQDSLLLVFNGTPIPGDDSLFLVPIWVRIANVAGKDPFMKGPTSSDWSGHISLFAVDKNSSGSHYVVYRTLPPGDYQVDLGKDWGANDWLDTVEQAGCQYYDSLGNGMKWRVMSDGSVLTWRNAIPSFDTGHLVPPYPDSLYPAGYGDAGINWRTRFRDIIHGNGRDSEMIFGNFAGLGNENLPMRMQTNITGKPLINLSAYSSSVGYTIIAVADIPDLGLIWTYGRGNIINNDFLSLGKYWSTSQNAFWAVWKFVSLAKMTAAGNHFAPAGR